MQDLNDLVYFVQVVEHRGFAPAARALGLQKSRLSRRIAQLEERLGTRLIQRSSRRFSVTEIGQVYHRHCVAMLVEAEAAQAVIDCARSEPRGTLRIACAPGLVTYQMGGLISAFMDINLGIIVHLESTSRRVDVIGEGFDLAIRARRPPLEASELVMRKLGDDVHRLVASPALSAKWDTPTGPDDLRDWPTVDFGPPLDSHAWTLRHDQGSTVILRHTPRLVTDDVQMLHRAALDGLGAALLPAVVVMPDIEAGRLVDILPEWRSESWLLHLVFPSRRGLLPAVRQLIEFIADACDRPQDERLERER